jgi:hypothetical protein
MPANIADMKENGSCNISREIHVNKIWYAEILNVQINTPEIFFCNVF